MLAIKCTGADYFLNWPTTDAITSGLPKQRPMMVLFDTFREYDGWSRLFIFMKRWEDTVRACRDNGVQSINAWGPWSPGCIWDDQGGRVSWIGHWETFRTFLNGFTPGQANVYLLGRLSWNPDEQAADIA